MFSRMRDKLGSAGLVIAVVALIAALAGTAFAALPGLNSKQKKEVNKIAKKFAGVPGTAGQAGPAGVAGQAGKDGANGTNGTNGKSVITGSEAPGTGNCEGRGGAWVEVEGSGAKRYVCNGKDGSAGAGGQQTILQSGETSTGLWSFENDSPFYMETISFPLQVEEEPDFNLINMETNPPTAIEGELAACPGTLSSPEAEPGEFCMYAKEIVSASLSTANAYTVDRNSGFIVEFSINSGATGYGYGSWAVQAE
jgi:hypothetical protein